ncbi:uncharacterized protein LOC143753996 [Siphateles boraxobius]|uniref:uncharacterized protein LOC143753996 n=1 Tax=Siphateles boraxobius TaxID=180520 RepID=UPI004064AF8B
MSVSLKELCQMVNVPYDQARALIDSESSDGESVTLEKEEATVVEDTVVHADFSGGLEEEEASLLPPEQVQFDTDFSGGLEEEEASLLAPEQVQFDTVFHGGGDEDSDAEHSCSDAEEDASPRKRLRAENTWKKVINKKRRMVGKSYIGKQKQKETMREPRAMGPRCSSAACARSGKHHCSAIGEPERNTKVPLHYCRSTTSKQYLEPVFQSMADLYAVYCRAAAEKNVTPLSRQVFTNEFKRLNLGLYHPKKDQCNICCAFKTGNLPDDEWQHHLLQKEEARAEKLSDKSKASNNTMVLCAQS